MKEDILEVEKLKIYYEVKAKNPFVKNNVKAVDGISFAVAQGETFGLVGESGCGKSTTGAAIVGLKKPFSGRILLDGVEIGAVSRREMAEKVQIIFQDPYSSLDPRFTIGRAIGEPLEIHRRGNSRERKERVLSLMADVGLREHHYNRYPHEFSGGQRQRAGVARALALSPRLVVCDEPVSSLDVSIQAQILNLMQDLQQKYRLTYIFISHNLSVVKHICDRVAVMYLGHIMEMANKEQLFAMSLHPYTRALMEAIPIPDPDVPLPEHIIEGDVPSPLDPPSGCVFHTRCLKAQKICTETVPEMESAGKGHYVACHYWKYTRERKHFPDSFKVFARGQP